MNAAVECSTFGIGDRTFRFAHGGGGETIQQELINGEWVLAGNVDICGLMFGIGAPAIQSGREVIGYKTNNGATCARCATSTDSPIFRDEQDDLPRCVKCGCLCIGGKATRK